MSELLKQTWRLLKKTGEEWSDDYAAMHAAALAFYAIFSMAPVLVIAIAVAGLALGQSAAQGEVLRQVASMVGPDTQPLVAQMVKQIANPTGGILATVAGLATLLIGASGAFGQLQLSLNMMWHATPRRGRGLYYVFRDRALSFGMVLGVGFLLLASFFTSVALSAALTFFSTRLPLGFIQNGHLIDLSISFGMTSLLFAVIYKVLPDVRIGWRDVWIGATVTALLFGVGKMGISQYLARSGLSSTYGAASALVAILLWVFLSAQLLLFGAEFTQVYARTYGSHRFDSVFVGAATRETVRRTEAGDGNGSHPDWETPDAEHETTGANRMRR